MKNIIKIFILLIAIPVLYFGCRPNLFSPVKKRIIGTWQLSPVDSCNETWTFEKGGSLDGTLEIMRCNTLLQYNYEIKNKLTKRYLETDVLLEGFTRWRVIKLNKKEMYLSSRIGNVKGSAQRGFLRKN